MTADSSSGPPARVLLMDVARMAGVSRTTASFVLTGRTDMGISAGAAARVRQAARDLGYRPSLLARSLRTNASHTIGLLSDGLGGDLFAGELIRGTQASAVLHDKMIFVGERAETRSSRRGWSPTCSIAGPAGSSSPPSGYAGSGCRRFSRRSGSCSSTAPPGQRPCPW